MEFADLTQLTPDFKQAIDESQYLLLQKEIPM